MFIEWVCTQWLQSPLRGLCKTHTTCFHKCRQQTNYRPKYVQQSLRFSQRKCDLERKFLIDKSNALSNFIWQYLSMRMFGDSHINSQAPSAFLKLGGTWHLSDRIINLTSTPSFSSHCNYSGELMLVDKSINTRWITSPWYYLIV